MLKVTDDIRYGTRAAADKAWTTIYNKTTDMKTLMSLVVELLDSRYFDNSDEADIR